MSGELAGMSGKMTGGFLSYLTSSIGRKQVMGIAGLMLVLFLVGHMLGNLQLLKPDPVAAQTSYNAYCQFLTSLVPMLWIVEAVLGTVFLIHFGLALVLKLGNLKARGQTRYAVVKHKGPATPAAYTMLATGVVVLVFLVQHLLFFKFGHYYLYLNADGEIVRDMWLTTVKTFANPAWTAGYSIALLLAGVHLAHAVPSLFRTFGLVHARWTPIFNRLGVLAAVALTAGYVLTAVGTCWLMNRPAGKALIKQSESVQEDLKTLSQIQKTAKAEKAQSSVQEVQK